MNLKLDQHSSAKFFGWYNVANKMVLVFEWLPMDILPMDILEYSTRVNPLTLSEIRTVVQQV